MDGDGREVLFHQKLCQSDTSLDTLDKDDHLVEFEYIQKFEKFAIFFRILEFEVVLLQTMKCQLGLIVDIDFHRL